MNGKHRRSAKLRPSIVGRLFGAIALILAPLCAPAPCLAQPEVEEVLSEIWPDRPRHPVFMDPVALDSPNAAGRYLWLFGRLDEPLKTLASWLPSDKLVFEFDPELEAPGTADELRAKLIAQQEWILALIEATKVERFDLYYTEGLAANLANDDSRRPILSGARAASRVLRADAVRLWLDGEHAEAGDRLAAMLQLAVHFSDLPSPMINQLVAMSLLRQAHDTCILMLAAGQPALPERQRAGLLRVLDRMDPKDPVGRRVGWETYRSTCRQFAGEQLAGDEIGDPLLAMLAIERGAGIAIKGLFDKLTKGEGVPKADDPDVRDAAEEAAEELDALTHEQLTAELKAIDDLTTRIKSVWEDADAKDKIKAMEEEWADDESGLSAFILAFPRIAQRDWQDSVAWVKALRAKLEAGPASP